MTNIHPHKGYLNTVFHLHASGTENTRYSIAKVEETGLKSIIDGTLIPNTSKPININEPGTFKVEFSDGSSAEIVVEDGYKFGGSNHKASFVFDQCPWAFVIMRDRTYFYNRETHSSYVENISPDKITEISKDYVILENNSQEEKTIYSLEEERPILCISNIVAYNQYGIIWHEKDVDDSQKMCVFSFESRVCQKFDYALYAYDKSSRRLITSFGNDITHRELGKSDTIYHDNTIQVEGEVVSIVAPNLVITYNERPNVHKIQVYDAIAGSILKEVPLNGYLSRVHDNTRIDRYDRLNLLKEANLSLLKIPEAIVCATYCEVYFYPCSWDVFYTVRTYRQTKSTDSCVEEREEAFLYSFNSDLRVKIKQPNMTLATYLDAVCLYNDQESFIKSKNYPGSEYNSTGKIYKENDRTFLWDKDVLYVLTNTGSWKKKGEYKLDFEKYSTCGIVKDLSANSYRFLNGVELGDIAYERQESPTISAMIRTNNYFLFPKKGYLYCQQLSVPDVVSAGLHYGLSVKRNNSVIFFERKSNRYNETAILKDLLDTSNYRDVLLSEDGNKFVYNNGSQYIVRDIKTSETQTFDKFPFIKHVNGIRPLFSTPSSLQPRLVNPVTRQLIDCNSLLKYHFISPDGKLYAETQLEKYIEYCYRRDGSPISQSDYYDLLSKCTYPAGDDSKSAKWLEANEARQTLINDNLDYFTSAYKNKSILKKKIEFLVKDASARYFLDEIIERKGVAVIRHAADDSEAMRINLGIPLSYINYVSFSYDSKYVAIAGYRNDGHHNGGLLLIHDIVHNQTVFKENTKRAVWNVAFSKLGALASYTSNPFTFYFNDEGKYEASDSVIAGRNFLTFSPDGKYYALSSQGYVSKYDRLGNVQSNWGHQPSCLVEVRSSDKVIKVFSDLSDKGISDSSCGKSVASVSFSNDNKHLMMSGNDGVVIIRNLNL